MYSPIKLDIIRTFGNKDINFGCRLVIDDIIYTYVDYNKLYEDIGNGEVGDFYRFNDDYDEILGHIPHFERILEVLYAKDIGVTLWNMHKRTIVLEFLNENDPLLRTREIDYDWIKQPIEQDEKVLKELLEVIENN